MARNTAQTTNDLESGVNQVDHVYQSSRCKGEDCCCCLGAALMGTMYLAMRVACACFAISGAVFLADQYTDIPSCASSYKGWSITMTVLYGLSALRSSESSEKTNISSEAGKVLGVVLAIVAILPGLIAGLGHRDVLQVNDNCDISSIHKLETWTWWIVIFNMVLTILLLVASVVLCVTG